MRALTTALTLALLLSACGGGDDDTLPGDVSACTTTVLTDPPKPGAPAVANPPVYLSIRCADGERVTTTPVVCTGSDACR